MTYDFDTPVNREGTFSLKWDASGPDTLPMWVADMDFKTAPAITEALIKRAAHGIFGYTKTPPQYYQAVTDWFLRRHAWAVQPGWILTAPGVVPALCAIIQALTNPGDKIILQTPVYNCFFSSINDNKRRTLYNPLVYKNNTYYMDFEDLEQKAAQENVKFLLLCNPHNPAGRVWTPGELRRMGDICLRHGVFVVADEIHCDLVMPGYKYTPFASLSDGFLMASATCTAPTKTFNIAGLQIANITVADEDVRRRVDRAVNINEVCDVGVFGVTALQAAYNHGGEWLDELLAYLHGNYECLKSFFAANLPQIPVTKLEGTYLVWLDCAAIGKPSSVIVDELLSEKKLWLNGGDMYGEHDHPFVRMNIACPRSVMLKGLGLFADYVASCLNG